MGYKVVLLALVFTAFIPLCVRGNDDKGSIDLTFKYCRQDLQTGKPFDPSKCTEVKPANGARIIFRDQKIGRTRLIADSDGRIQKIDMAIGPWTLGIFIPPPNGAVPKLLSSRNQTRITVNSTDKTVDTFYLILPASRSSVPFPSEISIGIELLQKVSYGGGDPSALGGNRQGPRKPPKKKKLNDARPTTAGVNKEISGKIIDSLEQPLSGALVECLVLVQKPSTVSLFSLADLKDPAGLAVKLRNHQDSLSQYLRSRLSSDLQQQLEKNTRPSSLSTALQSALVGELNQLLKGSGLFDERRFAQVTLTESTRRLLAEQPNGADLVRLNRLLLEEAYPDELAKSNFDEILQLDKTTTDNKGHYTLTIPDDKMYESYVIAVSHDSFYSESVTILWGESPPSTITLEEESVATESQAASSSNSDMARRAVFQPQLMQTLPVPGLRSFDYFALLAPGVSPPPESIGGPGPGVSPGVGTAGQFSVNGMRSRENNFTMDGSDNNDEDIGTRRQGFVLLAPQPIETLQEFQIITALADARFGRNLGGHVNALTQSGSLGVHGQVFGFFTDNRWNARDFFDQTTDGASAGFTLRRSVDGAPVMLDGSPLVVSNPAGGKDKLSRMQGGVIIGGRLSPIDTFFFGSFDRLVVRATRESHFAVPTVAQRGIFGTGETGSFHDFVTPVQVIRVRYYPASTPGNAILSLYPFPNNPLGPYGANTYSTVLPADADGTRFSGKLSKQFGSSNPSRKFKRRHFFWAASGDTLTGRYNFTQDKSILPVIDGALYSSLLPRVRTQNVALFFNRTITKSVTDTIRFSIGRTRLSFDEVRDPNLVPSKFFPNTPFLLNAPLLLNITLPNPNGTLTPTTYVAASSLPGSAILTTLGYGPVRTTEEITGALGQVVVPGFSSLGVDTNYFPQSRANNTFQLADTITYVRKNKVYSFGFDIRRTHINSTQDRGFRPQAMFNGLRASTAPYIQVTAPGAGPLPDQIFSPSTFAAMGAPTGLFQTLAVVPDPSIGLRFTQVNLFFQEERRVRPNLSLTWGVRYELNTVPETVGGRLEQAFNLEELNNSVNQALPACVARLGAQLCNDTANTILAAFPADFKLSFGADRNDLDVRFGFAWDPTGKGRTVVRGGFGSYSGQVNGLVLGQSRNAFPDFLPLNFAAFPDRTGGFGDFLFNPANPVIRAAITGNLIRAGTLNTITNGNTIDFLLNGSISGTGLDVVLPQSKLKGPYAFQYGLTVERVLRGDYLIAVAYIGTYSNKLLRLATPQKGVNLSRFDSGVRNINRQSLQFPFPSFFGPLLPPQEPTVKSYVQIVPTFFESSASSTYNSLQVEVRKRYRRHFQLGTALTYSHSADDSSDYLDTAGAFALPQNSLVRSERGSSNFDMRLRSVTSFVVDLPRRWQAAGIFMAQTGQPFTVNTVFDINRDGNLTDRLNSTMGIVTNPASADPSVRLGLAPGTDPMSLLAPDGQDGAVGRNTFRAASAMNFDLSLMRNFTLGGERKIQFRTEIFNLFNRTNFAIPVRILEAPAFGRSVRTITQARTIQFGFKASF